MFADVCVNNFSKNLIEGVSPYKVEDYKRRNQDIFVNLEEYLLDEGNIFSADKIIEKLFPQVDVDIFLSHSHLPFRIYDRLSYVLFRQPVQK